jgi:hypothetical protein
MHRFLRSLCLQALHPVAVASDVEQHDGVGDQPVNDAGGDAEKSLVFGKGPLGPKITIS